MAAPTWAEVFTLVRQKLDDRDISSSGLVWDNANLYDFATSAQRDLFMRLCVAGRSQSKATITRDLEVGENTINFAVPTGDTLPDDFVAPEMLWEKAFGAADRDYVEMSHKQERLPDELPTTALRYWMWQDSSSALSPAIITLGATTKRTVRIQYHKEPPAVSSGTTRLYVPGSFNALAAAICMLAAQSRKRWDIAAQFGGEYSDQMANLGVVLQKNDQRRNRRRMPYRWAGFLK